MTATVVVTAEVSAAALGLAKKELVVMLVRHQHLLDRYRGQIHPEALLLPE